MPNNKRKVLIIIITIISILLWLFCGYCFANGIIDLKPITIVNICIINGILFGTIYIYFANIRKQEDEITTTIDPLTGLANIHSFCRLVENRLELNPTKKYIIAYSDINRFKIYNDSFGSNNGDRVLKYIAAVLKEGKFYDGILEVGYLNADHFVMCFESDNFDGQKVYDTFVQCMNDADVNYNFSFKIGYVVVDVQSNIRESVDKALLALGSIKNNYDQNWALFDKTMYEKIVEEEELGNQIKMAIERSEIVVYLQPQYNYNNKTIIGCEALARWVHPTKGLIPPSQFIPTLEKTGYIYEVDKFIWNKVAQLTASWKKQGIKVPPVSVNISRIDIYRIDFLETLTSIIENNGLSYDDIRLEITESAYTDNPDILLDVVNKLKDLGFYLEMDDFGSGYSSLNILKDLPMNMVKLDMKFMHESAAMGRGGSILSSIIRMAYQINTVVLAEGVETKQQADFLKSVGCYYMQGYYFSKPLCVEEFINLLNKNEISSQQDDVLFEKNVEEATDFLDDRTQSALLFNSFVGGAVILEYNKNNISAIRTNDMFFKELGVEREKWDLLRGDFHKILNDSQYDIFEKMIQEAIESRDDIDSDVYFDSFNSDKRIHAHTRARYLSRKGDAYLLYCYVENVTKSKENEANLRLSQAEYKAAAIQTQKLICRYIIKDRALAIEEDMAQIFKMPAYVNDAPENYVERNLIGKSSIENWFKVFREIEEGSQSGSIDEIEIANIDNDYRWYSLKYTNIQVDEDNRVAVLALADITEVRALQKERALEFGALVKALSNIYMFTIACNPQRNSYYVLSRDQYANLQNQSSGDYDDLINDFASYIEQQHEKELFINTFASENIDKYWQQGKGSLTIQHRYRDENGDTHWMETTALLIDNTENKQHLHILMMRNIDKQKHDEQVLQETLDNANKKISISEKEYLIANSMSQLGRIIVYYDVATHTLSMPDKYANQHGMPTSVKNYPQDDMVLPRLPNPEDITRLKQFFKDIEDGVPSGTMEMQFLRIDGTSEWEKDEWQTIFDEDGKPVRAIISVEDTTLQHEESFRNQQQINRLQSLITTAVRTTLEYLCVINIETDKIESFAFDNTIEDEVTKATTFTQAVEIIVKQMPTNQREQFIANSNLKRIVEVMNKESMCSYQYELNGDRREVSFYWNDDSQQELIMTVVNIQKSYELQQGLDAQNFVRQQIHNFENNRNTKKAIDELMEALCVYAYGDRAFFFHMNEDGEKISCEWHKENVASLAADLDMATYDNYKNDFERAQEYYYVQDTSSLDLDGEFAYLKQYNVQSFITFPLMQDGKPLGIIGIDNPDATRIDLIKNIFFFITKAICERLILEERNKKNVELESLKDIVVDALNSVYICNWQIDLKNNIVKPFNDSDYQTLIYPIAKYNPQLAFEEVVKQYSDDRYRQHLSRFLDLGRIKQSLPNTKNEFCLYHSKRIGMIKLVLNFTKNDENNELEEFMIGFQNVDDSLSDDIINKHLAKQTIDVSNGIWSASFDHDGNINSVNLSEGYRKMLGFENEEELPNVLDSWIERIHEDDRQNVLAMFNRTIADDSAYDVKYRMLTKENQYRYYRAAGRITRRSDGTPLVFAGAIIDIDNEERKQLEIRDSQIKYQKTLAVAQIGVFTINYNDNRIVYMSGDATFYKLIGLPEDFEGDCHHYYGVRINKDDMSVIHNMIKQIINNKHQEDIYLWNHPTLGEVYVQSNGFLNEEYTGEGYQITGFLKIVNDEVTKEKKMLKELQEANQKYREADYDKRRDFLTGLYNRLDMYEMFNDLQAKNIHISAMYMMDIDNYKKYNDTYGHSAGDECLRKVGAALIDYGNKHNMRFYRYGGEEMLGISTDEKIDHQKVAQELVDLIRDLHIERQDNQFGCVTVSVGYSISTGDNEKMVDKADKAMYKAKDDGKNRWTCYEEM